MLPCICCGASPVEGVGDELDEVVCESDIDMTVGVCRGPSLRVVTAFVVFLL